MRLQRIGGIKQELTSNTGGIMANHVMELECICVPWSCLSSTLTMSFLLRLIANWFDESLKLALHWYTVNPPIV